MLISEPAAALGLDAGAVTITGPDDVVASRYRVTEAVTASVACAALALAEWAAADGRRRPDVAVDTRAAVTAAESERHLRVDAAPVWEWAPLSGLCRARDGWVRLHANYEHHRAALCAVLGIGDDRGQLEDAVAHWTAQELEDALAAAGGVGVRVREPHEWQATPMHRAVGSEPLVAVEERGAVTAERRSGPVRVLDLTRVLAGPVATRMLGLGGADVLRIDRPDRPEAAYYADTGLAKRSALADLTASDDISGLLAAADVVVIGYRPDALAGLRAALETLPSIVVVELSAWGWTGPWRDRRGFDSIVQAACGINVAEGTPDRPAQLPFQALDHSTGYLAAACAWHGLARRAVDGIGRRYRLSLARTAHWLGAPRSQPSQQVEAAAETQTLDSGYGRTTVVAPPFTLDGSRPRWPRGAELPGTSRPAWR